MDIRPPQLAVALNPLLGLTLLAILAIGTWASASGDQPTLITLDSSITYQTIRGWETTAQVGQFTFPALFHKYKNTVFDLAVNDLGINRVRLEINSGAENPQDYFTPFINGRLSRPEWKEHWYEIINDNNDPFTINWEGFQFSWLDHTVDNVVLPLKKHLESRGERLFINFSYNDLQCCRGSSTLRHSDFPDEYAEFMLASMLHLRRKYGLEPDAIEVIRESDNAGWSARQIADVLIATAKTLKDHQFAPSVIAPSSKSMVNSVTYFDEMVKNQNILEYLSEMSYHRYRDVSDEALHTIAQRSIQYRINTSMPEHLGSDYHDLHKDLKIGRNSAWGQYTLAFPTEDNGAQYYWIDSEDSENPIVMVGERTKFLRQYFKFIRRDARRIEAIANNSAIDPLAFINPNGKYTVVLKANNAASIAIQGLPNGLYGCKYTTLSRYDVDVSDVTLHEGQLVHVTMPESGVMTVYAK